MFQRVLIGGAVLLVLVLIVLALANNKPPQVPAAGHPVVLIETAMGNVKLELYPEKTPTTVANFLQYVEDKHYDNTLFHRVMSTFMIQGGGYEVGAAVEPDTEKKTRPPIKNECRQGLSNERGTVAMARTGDPHSATAQFFINVVPNPFLDGDAGEEQWGDRAFGKVIEGMDVVDKIKSVPVDRRKENRPLEDVIIKTVRRIDK